MSFKNSLNNTVVSRGGGGNSSKKGGTVSSIFGRVVDIILDENHPEYKNKGGGIAINGVFYRPLQRNNTETVVTDLPFAYQNSSYIKTVPILGEIVEVVLLPNLAANLGGGNPNTRYYKQIVNIWNSPNTNVYPDMTTNSNIDISTKGAFKELSDINPIRSTPGDVQIEGRQGQSIRFTGGKGSGNSYVDDSNIGKPVIIISNGQSQTDNGFTTLSESVDDDSCSIYMASDHQIPLTPASTKREACNDNPLDSNQFKGSQIILNGGRLYFNAKQDDIQLSSISAIGMNTNGSVNIDATTYFCVDGSQIFLGSKARTAPAENKEPVLLGNQTENFLNTLLRLLEGMAKDMSTAKTVDQKPIPQLNKRGTQMLPVIRNLKTLINPNGQSILKSKKVFTE